MREDPIILEIDDEIAELEAQMSKKPDIQVEKEDKEAKERSKTRKWMNKYRGKHRFREFKDKLQAKFAVSRSNWLNLPGIATIFTNILSIFTIFMLCSAMYYTVDHLKNGSNFALIIAGAILIGIIGWTNSRIGSDAQTNETIPQQRNQ